mmetsp:Transcript_28520/g.37309  ORF Transcript_28520/g.37309 Transcript_28520/m.37309 type:complete len:283 (+) Transcript_28520:166-1014(+)
MSKRFETTTKVGMQAAADRLHEVDDRKTVIQRLKERKAINTSASIVVGTDRIQYETDAMARNQSVQEHLKRGGTDLRKIAQQNREMKMALTRTHFEVGTDDVDYKTTNKMADPTGRLGEYRGTLNNEMKQAIRQSNLYMGDAAPTYTSTAHESMVYKGRPEEYVAMKNESRRLKKELGTHSFTYGEEKVDYETDFKAGYQYDPEQAKTAKPENNHQMLGDLRSSHFVFGNEEVRYESDAMAAQRSIDSKKRNNPLEDKQRNATLKQQLMKTNYQIGHDEEYM